MKKITMSLLLALCFASLASAELLVTANPLGQGKMAFAGAYVLDSNYQNSTGLTLGTIGGYFGYGITDKLDTYLQYGQGTAGGTIPTGIGGMSGTGYGASLKYTILDEGVSMPVSVALGGGYKSFSNKVTITGLGDITSTSSQMMIGVGVSKIMAPFVPYGAIAYRSTNVSTANSNSTQLDLTVGTAIAWSMQGAVMIEYSMQSITPQAGSSYTGGEIAASVAYRL
ncbi:MAG: hypothetical protein WCW67_05155 [Candidatus Margulisiibacteriota bacterium]|jgi:hypothetical protein